MTFSPQYRTELFRTANVKAWAKLLVKKWGVQEANARGEEIMKDSIPGRGIISNMIVRYGTHGQTITSLLAVFGD